MSYSVINTSSTKICTKCNIEKFIGFFRATIDPNNKNIYHYSNKCKQCLAKEEKIKKKKKLLQKIKLYHEIGNY